jgi:hypothetical protein
MSILGNSQPGTYSIQTYNGSGTADVAAAIAAPGATYRIVVTGIGFSIGVAESGKVLTVKDANTSAVTVCTIPLSTAGASAYWEVNVPCTINKALSLDTDGSTGKWHIIINYYLEKTS